MPLPPSTINVSGCWPQYVEQSRKAAEFINEVLTTSNHPRLPELKRRFDATMDAHVKAGLCPFVPGNGPTVEESHAVFKLAEELFPTITPQEEAAILQATLPIPVPEPSFLRRNAVPLFVGGGVLLLGIIGMLLMLKV